MVPFVILDQPRSQGLLRFQDGGRHLESGVDPGNEVDTGQKKIHNPFND